MQSVKSVKLFMKNGDELIIDLSEKLVNEIANTFQINPELVNDNHVKYYLASSMKKALESHERFG